jgi:hypothetical protein
MFENSSNYTNTLISNSSDEKKIRGIGIDLHYSSYGNPWDHFRDNS